MYTKDNILSLEEVKRAKDGTKVTGLIFIKDYTKKPTKNGSTYFVGTCEAMGSLEFKVWSNSPVYSMIDSEDYKNEVCFIEGKVNIFNGAYSLILDKINSIDLEDSPITYSDFFEVKYDTKKLYKGIHVLLEKMCKDPNSIKVFDLIMSDPTVEKRFLVEFAAKTHHDNCLGGLVAHTNKVLSLSRFIAMYPNIIKIHGNMDIIAVGCALHDVGKIFEYDNGVISEKGAYLSHNTYGVLLLNKYKDKILQLVDEDFYYRLISIVEQHHGEFGDYPRTFEAYIVHLIDKFESTLTEINQVLDNFEVGNTVYYEKFYLS